jgi:hypothetical protein
MGRTLVALTLLAGAVLAGRLRRLGGVWRRLPDDHHCSDHQRC